MAVAAARWPGGAADGKIVVEMDGGSATVFIGDDAARRRACGSRAEHLRRRHAPSGPPTARLATIRWS